MRRATRSFITVFACALAVSAQPAGDSPGLQIARAAREQIGVTTIYDPSYARIDYPGGDVPKERGVCADVIIRAFREIGVDLQVEVHEDMARNFGHYPRNWRLSGTDRNIDHRRVPNLMTFFARRGKSVHDDSWEAGDVVAWLLPNGLHHIGIVSASFVPGTSRPLMIHNIGRGSELEDVLREFTSIGHYRW